MNGRGCRHQPLELRQGRLQALLARFGSPAVQPSEAFSDGVALLQAAEKHALEAW